MKKLKRPQVAPATCSKPTGLRPRFLKDQHVNTEKQEDELPQEPAPETPADDFPLGKACDLSGEGDCEACQ